MMTFNNNPTIILKTLMKKFLHLKTLDLKNVVNITALDKVEQKTLVSRIPNVVVLKFSNILPGFTLIHEASFFHDNVIFFQN